MAFSDNYGLDSYQVIIDGKEVSETSTITGFGKHMYHIKAVDYAGNETILEGEFHIVGELRATQIKSDLTEDELTQVNTWLTLEEGTRAVFAGYENGKATVVLSNGIEEKTVEYVVHLMKHTVPNEAPVVPMQPEVHMAVPNEAPIVPMQPEAHMAVPNEAPVVEKMEAHVKGNITKATLSTMASTGTKAVPAIEQKQTTEQTEVTRHQTHANDEPQLPTTGEQNALLLFGASAVAILASVGLVVPKKKEE